MSAETVRSLMLSDGPFRVAEVSIFDTIITWRRSFPQDSPPARRGTVLCVTVAAKGGHLTFLLESIGAMLVSLNELNDCVLHNSPASHSAWAVAVPAHCPSARAVSLRRAPAFLLEFRAGRPTRRAQRRPGGTNVDRI